MLKIEIPDNWIAERNYILSVIFEEFLGLEVHVEVNSQAADYIIEVVPGRALTIRDHFFHEISQDTTYLVEENIPDSVCVVSNGFIVEKNLIAIFGDGEFSCSESDICCGVDIFASSFFMLSRWEEYVSPHRDKHVRFPAEASLAAKNGFLLRPVVNEYVEMLWSMLRHLGYEGEQKKHSFMVVPTHDVDSIYSPSVVREIGYDLLVRKEIGTALRRLLKGKWNFNYHDTFDMLMELGEQAGIQSVFYFQAEGIAGLDASYKLHDTLLRNTVAAIRDRGHTIGLHPGYNSFKDLGALKMEKKRLESVFSMKINESRNHFLRFSVPETFKYLDETGVDVDSTLGYADQPGFRCGTGNEYSIFDIVERIHLGLKERPLLVMDTTLKDYLKLSVSEAFELADGIKKVCIRYSMPYTILFHNSSFDPFYWRGWLELYKSLIYK